MSTFHPRLTQFLLLIFILNACTNSENKDNVTFENDFEDLWETYQLHYDQPTVEWNQALPIGNGRLGAMVFGGVEQEIIQLNEETLWTGGPYDASREGGAEALPEIQRLVFEEEFAKAHDLFGRTMMGIPYEQMKYQPLADLILDFPGHQVQENYRRTLSLDKAFVTVEYSVGGVDFRREVFSSYPDDVIVIRISSSEKGKLNFSANLHGRRNPSHSNYDNAYFLMDGLPPDRLQLTGRNADYLGIEGKLKYKAVVKARTDGGEIDVDYRTLHVKNANSATLIISAATNFVNFKDVSGDESAKVEEVLSEVRGKSFESLYTRHVEDHRSLFRQLSMDFEGWEHASRTTNDRLTNLDSLSDSHLLALYYQFSRYLLISSSRPGTQPANLQGIWNRDVNPWWDSKYTVNINLPMNYWPVEVANLEECAYPLFDLIREVSITGKSVAQKHYGAEGWVLHQNTDIWRASAPMDGPSWGAWPVGGAWLITHIWEHFQYNGDTVFLREYYPIFKDQVRFQMDILVEDPETGYLVTNPSNSPENFPKWEGNERFFDETSGISLKARTITAGPTMDMSILRELFAEFAEISQILAVDTEMREEVLVIRERLAPLQIGKRGQLQEWMVDWDEVEPGHRHLSHLWGAYPGREITLERSPELAQAVRRTMEERGIGGCGWSMGHRMTCWARLMDGNAAYEEFKFLLQESSNPNMFCNCFRALQVDGNFGAAAGIAEMLMQSYDGYISVLPALPDILASGEVRGFRARGGFELDFSWEEKELISLTVRSKLGKRFILKSHRPAEVLKDGQLFEQIMILLDGATAFDTEVGGKYELSFE